MKRFFSIIAVVSLLVFMFPQTALAKNNTDLNRCKYNYTKERKCIINGL